MKIKIINKSTNPLPKYETAFSAGMDLMASLVNNESVVVKPKQRVLIKTDLFLELPDGYEASIRPRSGLALKKGITVLNSPGVIDVDFRGNIGIILINHSDEDFIVNQGDRIAQMVIAKFEKAEWKTASELSETERGIGGFGHTGCN